jgi:hypothetical protein
MTAVWRQHARRDENVGEPGGGVSDPAAVSSKGVNGRPRKACTAGAGPSVINGRSGALFASPNVLVWSPPTCCISSRSRRWPGGLIQHSHQVFGDRGRPGSRSTVSRTRVLAGRGRCVIGPVSSVRPRLLGEFVTFGNVLSDGSLRFGAADGGGRGEIAVAHSLNPAGACPPQIPARCGPCGPYVPSTGH